ncbi:hypothetical protein [Mesorhizobium sp. B261B1A]|uniref:hypothetical protein n=1 Tax=Mesorhizobium sp. B261B1A TaxID=2876671 RepID=UPI001CD0E517|nr:hypothetical protein [Mesorhizobium sp. B261B1A]MCA0057666.1 hypothetical protein [Mesorhizobium sp. B261B1A]
MNAKTGNGPKAVIPSLLALFCAGFAGPAGRMPIAKRVMPITLEDESGVASLVVWTKVFEKFRKAIFATRMVAMKHRIQRGEAVHLAANEIFDLSADLPASAKVTRARPIIHGRG